MLTILECLKGEQLHVFHSDRRFSGTEIFTEPEMLALCGSKTVDGCGHKIDNYNSVDQAKGVIFFMENYICKDCLNAMNNMAFSGVRMQ